MPLEQLTDLMKSPFPSKVENVFLAIHNGNVATIARLFEEDKNLVNTRYQGLSWLVIATIKNKPNIMRFLLNVYDTPAEWSYENLYLLAVSVLLNHFDCAITILKHINSDLTASEMSIFCNIYDTPILIKQFLDQFLNEHFISTQLFLLPNLEIPFCILRNIQTNFQAYRGLYDGEQVTNELFKNTCRHILELKHTPLLMEHTSQNRSVTTHSKYPNHFFAQRALIHSLPCYDAYHNPITMLYNPYIHGSHAITFRQQQTLTSPSHNHHHHAARWLVPLIHHDHLLNQEVFYAINTGDISKFQELLTITATTTIGPFLWRELLNTAVASEQPTIISLYLKFLGKNFIITGDPNQENSPLDLAAKHIKFDSVKLMAPYIDKTLINVNLLVRVSLNNDPSILKILLDKLLIYYRSSNNDYYVKIKENLEQVRKLILLDPKYGKLCQEIKDLLDHAIENLESSISRKRLSISTIPTPQ